MSLPPDKPLLAFFSFHTTSKLARIVQRVKDRLRSYNNSSKINVSAPRITDSTTEAKVGIAVEG